MANKMKEKAEHQKIKVFARLRPLIENEKAAKAHSVIEMLSSCEIAVKQHNGRKFRFNQVYGPNSSQVELYLDVIAPFVRDLLAGYNCTVLVYGTPGSGKTYTMMGDSTDHDVSWKGDHLAGFIPRACLNIFDDLQRLKDNEYTMRVSYIELQNEEIIDLLSETKTNSHHLRVSQNGQVYISNLTEMTVCSCKDIFDVFTESLKNKETAVSVNAHRIFTITIHIKEVTINGNDLMKTAKLNLVDMASLENTSDTSSSTMKNAHIRELLHSNSSINNFMKVIQALNEGHQYVPYKESKLTRILQESFGGCAKTSFIATISPSNSALEETLNVLDLANQVKNIVNTPNQNIKSCYEDLIKSMKDEVESFKKDLRALRIGRGICIDDENYKKLMSESEEYKKLALEKTIEYQNLEEKISQLETDIMEKEKQLKFLTESFTITKNKLSEKEIEAKLKEEEVKKEKFVADYFEKTNKEVYNKTSELVKVTDKSTQKNNLLHKKLETLYDKLGKNTTISETVFLFLQNNISNFKKSLESYHTEQNKAGSAVEETLFKLESTTKALFDTVASIKSLIEDFSRILLPEFEETDLHVNKQIKLHSQILAKTEQLACIYNRFSDVTAQFFAFRRTLLEESMKLFNHDKTNMKEMIVTASNIFKTLENTNSNIFDALQEINSLATFIRDEAIIIEDNLRLEQTNLFSQVNSWEDMKKNVTDSRNDLNKTKDSLWQCIKSIQKIHYTAVEKLNLVIDNCSTLKRNEFDLSHFKNNFEKSQQKLMEITEKSKKHIVEAQDELKGHIDEAQNVLGDLEEDCVINKNMTVRFKEVVQCNKLLEVSELGPVQDNISSDQNLLLKNIECFYANHVTTSALDNMCLNLHETIVNQMQPIEHEGDTPKRETYKYPNTLERQLHRNILLEKYNQIREVQKESDS